MKNGWKDELNKIEEILEKKFNKMEQDLFEFAYDRGYINGYLEGYTQKKFDTEMNKINIGGK
jgi:hypothetical protein